MGTAPYPPTAGGNSSPYGQTTAGGGRPRPSVNAGRLWAGGVATAVVAALVAVIGLVVAKDIFNVPVWLPTGDQTVMSATGGRLILISAGAAIVGTGLMQLLLIATPRPFQFFGWIMALAAVAAALWPFTTDMTTVSKVAGALISIVVGIAIWSLLAGVARSSLKMPPRVQPPPPPRY